MKLDSAEAYPLHWPPGRARTKSRKRADFHRRVTVQSQHNPGSSWKQKQKLTVADSRDRVHAELEMFGASHVVISSNLELRQDGLPRSNQREPADPGVAVYFQLRKQPHCLSCDTWDRAADNLAAIAKHVEAMRGQVRWGVGDVAAMFAGFKALPGAIITPAVMNETEAAEFIAGVIGAGTGAATNIMQSVDTFTTCYREAAKRLHPDANDGREMSDWHRLQQANDVLRNHHAGAA